MNPAVDQTCPLYVGGKWKEVAGQGSSQVFNPSRGRVIATVPMCGAAEVNEVVAAAKAAFPDWRDTPPNERAQVLFRLKILLEDAFEAVSYTHLTLPTTERV